MIFEYLIPIAIIVFVGFPHGAVDGVLILLAASRSWRRAVALFAGYLLVGLGTVGIWVLEPVMGLLLLVALSVYHFGRLDTVSSLELPLRTLRGLALGALPVVVISQAHYKEVEYLFQIITNKDVGLLIATLEVTTFIWATLIAWLAIVRRVFSLRQLCEISAIICLLLLLPPLWGFAFYFCAIHSFRHIQNVKNSILPINKNGWIVVAVLTILSALLVFIGFTWLDNDRLYKDLIQSTFIVLAALTVPHMILIDGYRILEKLDKDRPLKICESDFYRHRKNKS